MKDLREKRNCLTCEVEFKATQRALKKGHGKFCSVSCKSRYFWSQEGHRQKQTLAHLGKGNAEHLVKFTRSKKGREMHSIMCKEIAGWNKGKSMPEISDEKNYAWKGEGVGYRALHHWVDRKLGKPRVCSECKIYVEGKGIHWANKSGDYKRELTDWLRLCAKCHKAYDSKKMAIL